MQVKAQNSEQSTEAANNYCGKWVFGEVLAEHQMGPFDDSNVQVIKQIIGAAKYTVGGGG